MLGRILRIALAMVLIGILAFLYVMSQGGDLRRQTQIVSDLRTLREIDTGWNRDIAGARNDPLAAEAAIRTGADRLQPLLANLEKETIPLDNSALTSGVQSLHVAFVEKQRLVSEYHAVNEQVRAALRELLTYIAELRTSATDVAASQPATRARLAALDRELLGLNANLFRAYVQADDTARQSMQAALATIIEENAAYPTDLQQPLMRLEQPARIVAEQEPRLGQIARQIALLPTGPRIASLNDAYDREFQTIADEKERFRIYLVFYSAALLVFLGYVMWQLGQSYTKINQANEALRAANETLEQRVFERTRELSEALKHLKESELMLIQTEKMSSLGQMVAGIAHEINTPLAYLKSSLSSVKDRLPEVEIIVVESQKLLEMLEQGDVPDDTLSAQFARVSGLVQQFNEAAGAGELAQLAQDGLHGIDQISEIVLNLKNFSRLDRSKLQRFNLNEGIESTLVIARNMVKHKTLHRQLGEIPLVECSPSQINQVLLNLITNAAQATEDGPSGEITVATRQISDREVRIDVTDNGHGIPDGVLPKIFDPFFTTKDVGKGTGLGLSIAYKIVHEHGGRIDVASKVGQGTTFSVFLPVKAVQPQPVAA